jgi:diguanylate cyclase (GGDEF)-like protein/PAS domain S-box-containing protein
MPNMALPNQGKAAMHNQAEANLSALIESTEDFIWSVDLNFGLLTFNRALQKHIQSSFGTLAAVGRGPYDLLPAERAAIWPPLFQRAITQGPFRTEVPFTKGRTLEMSFNPILIGGKVEGISIFGKDITAHKAAELAHKHAEKRYQDIFDGALEGMFQTSPQRKPLAVNRAFARMLHYDSPADYLACVKDTATDVWASPVERTRWLQQATAKGAVRGFQCRLKCKDGAIVWVSMHSQPVCGPDGRLLHYEGFCEDITERKLSELQLRESGAFLRETQIVGSLGSYVLDFASGVWTGSEVLDALFGIDRKTDHTIELWTELIHPADRAMMVAYFENDIIRQRKAFDKEYRILRGKDKQERWLHGMGKLEFDESGTPLRMRGIIKDITTHKQAEIQLRESEERYRSSFEQAAVGITHSSFDGRMLRCNARFADFLGYTQKEVLGLTVEQITAMEDRAESFAILQRIATGAIQTATWEMRYIRKDGSLTWGKLSISAQHDNTGRALHFIGLVEDINALKAAEQNLAKVQEALRLSEERYRTAFQTSLDAININRIGDGRYVECNKAFLDIVGFAREEVIGRTSVELGVWANPDDRQKMTDLIAMNGSCRDLESRFRTKEGRIFWGLMSASAIEIGGVPCVLSITRDITHTKAAEERLATAAEALRVSEERYRKVFQTSLDPITINRVEDERYIDVNQAFLDVMGFERSEVIGRTSRELGVWVDARDRDNLTEILNRTAECQNLEVQFRKKNEDTIWALMSASVIDIDGVSCVLTIARDVSNAKAAEDEIRNLAFYDPLTGLPNRRLLLERLHQALSTSNRTGRLLALLFVDLDNFKMLNDTLGHQTGDLLLQEAARRLTACVRDVDTVGRLGGDEFVLMLEDLSQIPEDAAAQAQAVGEKILAIIGQSYILDGRECRSSASIGISVFGDRRESSNEVLQQADIAMYQAKAAGRNTMRFFAPALQAAVNARAALEEDLRLALRTNQFMLYYQPQVDRTRLVGVEALIRWEHPRRGILAPGEFVSLAEETGLIPHLGKWVLEAACAQIATWARSQQTAHLSISVNISARQFRQPEFADQVLTALQDTGANPRNLKLELTESMLVENIEEVIARMSELRSHGIRFSLDDFGTGYSSLAYLKRLPLDQLKIDRSFIHDILGEDSSGAIAQTIISLSKAMGLSVIAEGVETEEQRDCLLRLGCTSFQGYLFGGPLPVDEFQRRWLVRTESAIPTHQ